MRHLWERFAGACERCSQISGFLTKLGTRYLCPECHKTEETR